MKSRKPTIEWIDIPIGCVRLAERRTKDMLSHYGRNIANMRIETLVASCYLQGIEDCMTFNERKKDNE